MADENTLTVIENPTPEESAPVVETPAPPPEVVSIKTGWRRIAFKDDDTGDVIGVLRFRPADIGIIDRYNEAVTRWPELNAEIDGAEANGADSYEKAKAKLFEIMDFMLDAPVSKEVFANFNPFNVVGDDGAMFCEVVFDTVGVWVESELSVQLAKRAEREKKMAKYRPNRQQRRAMMK